MQLGLPGTLFLLIALVLYVTRHKRWSLLFYISFLSDGFEVLTDSIIGIKNLDLAFVYTIVILAFTAFYEKKQANENKLLRKLVLVMMAFIICSMVFSYTHYGFSPFQILQGGRHLLLFAGYFFVIKTPQDDVEWLIDKIFKITVVVSVLYILQVFLDLPLLSYGMEVKKDASTGISRYYNSPFYLPLSIYIGIFKPDMVKTRFRIPCLVILAIAQVATLGRVEIITTFMMVMLGILLRGNRSQIVKIGLGLSILLYPMAEILGNRFSKASELDVKAIFSGSYKDLTQRNISNNGTLTYRFAWVYERRSYLDTRPLSEKLFGFGLISDSQFNEVFRHYYFRIGLKDKNTGLPQQLRTPDIAYGNILSTLGYGGGALIMTLWIYMAVLGFRHRNDQPFEGVLFLLVTGYIIRSLSGTVISDPGNLIIPFLIYSCYPPPGEQKEQQNTQEA